jgi:hypothetical protein
MAIKVNARAIKQNTADASVFGYNTVYQSAAPAVGQALSQTANSIASANAKLKARQESNDRIAADANFASYRDGLTQATAQLNDAYSKQDPEAIATAETNFAGFDATQPNFSLGNFGNQEVTDQNSYATFNTDAKTLWTQTTVAERHRKEHYRNANFVKNDLQQVENAVFELTNKYTGQVIPMNELMPLADRINNSYKSDALDALASDKARTAAVGELNDKTDYLFKTAIRNAGVDVERIRAIKKEFIRLRGEGYFEGYTKSEELLTFADKAVAEVTKERIEEYADVQKLAVTNAAGTFYNTLDQKTFDGGEYQAALNFLESTKNVDPNLFAKDSTEYKQLMATREAAVFFLPADGADLSPYQFVVQQAFQESRDKGVLAEDSIKIPQEFEQVLARSEAFKGIRSRVSEAVNYINDGILNGNTAVLESFGYNTDLQKRKFLDDNGFTDRPVFNRSQIPFNIQDPAALRDYLVDTSERNQNPAAMMHQGHNLIKNGNSNEVLEGFLLQYFAMSGGAALDEGVALFSKFYTAGLETELTEDFAETKEILVSDESELGRLQKQAYKNGDHALVKHLDVIINGMVSDVMAQERPEVSGAGKLVGLPNKRLRRDFYDREDKLVSLNIGIARESKDGHQVRIPQQVIDKVDLEAKYPFLIADFPLRNIRNSEPYQRLTLPIESEINNGVYNLLPDMFTERYVEALTDEMVELFDFVFKEDNQLAMLDKLGGDFAGLAQEYREGKIEKEDLAESLREAKLKSRGAGMNSYLDFSTFGTLRDGSGRMGVAVRYYDQDTFTYRPLVDAQNNQVVVPISNVVKRIDVEGLYFNRGLETTGTLYGPAYFGNSL